MTQSLMLHGLPPVVDPQTRVMVLGSFPGGASLAAGQYYAHPRNQFWRILGEVLEIDLVALAYGRRLEHLLAARIGLWDVYGACERAGSLDAAIRNAQPNDFAGLLACTPSLERVCHNGQASARFARRFQSLDLEVRILPSTSPAHAARSYAQKLTLWREALN